MGLIKRVNHQDVISINMATKGRTAPNRRIAGRKEVSKKTIESKNEKMLKPKA